MGTGVGRTSYSIMAQGNITQILSSKPEDRRMIFEEAAGITKYKAQKKEALRKLEYTEQNLVRVLQGVTVDVTEYQRKRDLIHQELTAAGYQTNRPEGAFYFFVNASHIDADSYRLAFDILDSTGVAVTPGIDFGEHGEGYLRISCHHSKASTP
jgi:aspartate/methionine/tyrosine aminotransferase